MSWLILLKSSIIFRERFLVQNTSFFLILVFLCWLEKFPWKPFVLKNCLIITLILKWDSVFRRLCNVDQKYDFSRQITYHDKNQFLFGSTYIKIQVLSSKKMNFWFHEVPKKIVIWILQCLFLIFCLDWFFESWN